MVKKSRKEPPLTRAEPTSIPQIDRAYETFHCDLEQIKTNLATLSTKDAVNRLSDALERFNKKLVPYDRIIARQCREIAKTLKKCPTAS